jgi:hypothetical protein
LAQVKNLRFLFSVLFARKKGYAFFSFFAFSFSFSIEKIIVVFYSHKSKSAQVKAYAANTANTAYINCTFAFG